MRYNSISAGYTGIKAYHLRKTSLLRVRYQARKEKFSHLNLVISNLVACTTRLRDPIFRFPRLEKNTNYLAFYADYNALYLRAQSKFVVDFVRYKHVETISGFLDLQLASNSYRFVKHLMETLIVTRLLFWTLIYILSMIMVVALPRPRPRYPIRCER
jgi:hypothetical protein